MRQNFPDAILISFAAKANLLEAHAFTYAAEPWVLFIVYRHWHIN